eukprot:Skav234103  [mRNA]  locus=scaffold183:277427:286640:+ [translate_table: standard]
MRSDQLQKLRAGLHDGGISQEQVFVHDILRKARGGPMCIALVETGIELPHHLAQLHVRHVRWHVVVVQVRLGSLQGGEAFQARQHS